MNTNRKTAIIAGVLFITATAAGLLSVVPIIEHPDYLIIVSESEDQVFTGAFFQLVMAAAYVGIAISLYPILRKYNASLALGFAAFRIIAAMFLIIGVISLLLLLMLSQEFVKAGAPDSPYFWSLGGLLCAGRDLVNHVAMILSLSLGGLMFYYILYQTKLVPRWLSGWGLIGISLTISASLLLMFRLVGLMSTTYLVLNLPMALQEMVLAVWLIAKGFNPAAIHSGPVETD